MQQLHQHQRYLVAGHGKREEQADADAHHVHQRGGEEKEEKHRSVVLEPHNEVHRRRGLQMQTAQNNGCQTN